MYAFIEGTVAYKGAGELHILAGGVGYQLLCTQATLASAPQKGEFMRVYTWLSVRQEALELFGFVSPEERDMFLRLNAVTGIGPRTALGVLAALPLKDLTLAILTGDTAMLSRAPGIGKKTAQRIALELKDKMSAGDLSLEEGAALPQRAEEGGAVSEAILALQSLGYTLSEASRAASRAQQEAPADAHADELVRLALRGMTKG